MMLSELLGPWDIQLSALEETLGAGKKIPKRMYLQAIRGLRFQELLKSVWLRESVDSIIASSVKKSYGITLGFKPQHARAANIKCNFPEAWSNYKKFCVVRNPFSLAVSDYKWRTRHLVKPPQFLEYLTALAMGDNLGGVVPVGFHNNWYQYTIGGKIVVDEIIKFEMLSDDLSKFMLNMNMPAVKGLPHLKKMTGAEEQYHKFYNSKAVDLVHYLYKNEISCFGYTFE